MRTQNEWVEVNADIERETEKAVQLSVGGGVTGWRPKLVWVPKSAFRQSIRNNMYCFEVKRWVYYSKFQYS